MLGANGKVDLGLLQKVFTTFYKGMTKAQVATVDQAEKEWEEGHYPQDVQTEYHYKYGVRYNMAVDRSAFAKMGEYRVTLIIATGEDRCLVITWYDQLLIPQAQVDFIQQGRQHPLVCQVPCRQPRGTFSR